jgi:hypothetical protein
MVHKVFASSEFIGYWIKLFGLQNVFGQLTASSLRDAFLRAVWGTDWEEFRAGVAMEWLNNLK